MNDVLVMDAMSKSDPQNLRILPLEISSLSLFLITFFPCQSSNFKVFLYFCCLRLCFLTLRNQQKAILILKGSCQIITTQKFHDLQLPYGGAHLITLISKVAKDNLFPFPCYSCQMLLRNQNVTGTWSIEYKKQMCVRVIKVFLV